MRVLIVDDEPLARNALEGVLRARNDIESVDSAVDAFEALNFLQERPYDVLLLDIRMPELSGVELVDQLKKRKLPAPSVIFVTAYGEHAVAAFENHAVDYVLKPFSDERIHSALDTAVHRTKSERITRFMELLPQLESLVAKSSRIAIKTKKSIFFIDPAEVAIVEAQGNYVLLQRLSGSYLLRESISTIAQKLEPHGFVRIHRSILVNSGFVEEIRPWTTGEYVLRMKGGKELSVSRTYKKNLKSLAQFWVGTSSFAA
ncbi:MAG: LytTR family DNA-binding domain-containing protein, partial [Candidatus Acidiferrum sp.]